MCLLQLDSSLSTCVCSVTDRTSQLVDVTPNTVAGVTEPSLFVPLQSWVLCMAATVLSFVNVIELLYGMREENQYTLI